MRLSAEALEKSKAAWVQVDHIIEQEVASYPELAVLMNYSSGRTIRESHDRRGGLSEARRDIAERIFKGGRKTVDHLLSIARMNGDAPATPGSDPWGEAAAAAAILLQALTSAVSSTPEWLLNPRISAWRDTAQEIVDALEGTGQ